VPNLLYHNSNEQDWRTQRVSAAVRGSAMWGFCGAGGPGISPYNLAVCRSKRSRRVGRISRRSFRRRQVSRVLSGRGGRREWPVRVRRDDDVGTGSWSMDLCELDLTSISRADLETEVGAPARPRLHAHDWRRRRSAARLQTGASSGRDRKRRQVEVKLRSMIRLHSFGGLDRATPRGPAGVRGRRHSDSTPGGHSVRRAA